MNLEQIDTSTTAGKAEVMRLAAEGRQLLVRTSKTGDSWEPIHERAAEWGWRECEYAIQAERVGPDEVWVVLNWCGQVCAITEYEPIHLNSTSKVRYRRADIAGEVKP